MTNTKSHDQQGTRHKTHTVLTIIKIEACVYYFYVTHTHTHTHTHTKKKNSHHRVLTPICLRAPWHVPRLPVR